MYNWLHDKSVGHINEPALRWAQLLLGLVTVLGFNSAWPFVRGMSTGDVLLATTRKNGEFCVTVGPVTRTAGILA